MFLHDLIETHTRNVYKGSPATCSTWWTPRLHSRRKGDIVRLEIEAERPGGNCRSPDLMQFGLAALAGIQDQRPGTIFPACSLWADQTARPDLKFPAFNSQQL